MVYLRKTELSQLHRKKNNINNVLKALALKSFQVQKTAIAKTKTKKNRKQTLFRYTKCIYIWACINI